MEHYGAPGALMEQLWSTGALWSTGSSYGALMEHYGALEQQWSTGALWSTDGALGALMEQLWSTCIRVELALPNCC
jgi:hypothetical protein